MTCTALLICRSREVSVPIYRLYFLKNNCLDQWRDIEAPHDLAAIEVARVCQGEHSVELWFERRKITTFQPEQSSRLERDPLSPQVAAALPRSFLFAPSLPEPQGALTREEKAPLTG
jgi:hypothetical protein